MDALPQILRPFTAAKRELPRALVLTGHRGAGKTTFLLYHARGRRILYLSADNPLISAIPLYEAVTAVFMYGYEGVIIDEVHFAREWSIHLKALYDDFPDRAIWASDSSSLVLRKGRGDLSRRFVPLSMPLLSFREYASLVTGQTYPTFDPFDKIPVQGDARLLELFRAYRKHGTRPFFQEGAFGERMMAVLEKTLHSDIPFFIPRITDDNIRLMNAVVGYLAKSAIPRLHVRSLCADWNIGAEKLYQLLFVMESVGILRVIRKERDTKAQSVGHKLFFGDPVYYDVLGGDPGTAREALAAAMLEEAGMTVTATRHEPDGDFVVTRPGKEAVVLEVEGPSKGKKNADYLIRDDTDIPAGTTIPLWALGFMY